MEKIRVAVVGDLVVKKERHAKTPACKYHLIVMQWGDCGCAILVDK